MFGRAMPLKSGPSGECRSEAAHVYTHSWTRRRTQVLRKKKRLQSIDTNIMGCFVVAEALLA